MFEEVKYKNWYTAVLFILVLVVWIYNINKVAGIAVSEEKIVADTTDNESASINFEQPNNPNYSFKGDYRDPFRYSGLVQKKPQKVSPKSDLPKKVKKTKKEKPEKILLPDIQLTGLIEMTAIIQMPDHSTHFLGIGEKIKEIEVKKIWEDSVAIRYKDHPFTLRLSN